MQIDADVNDFIPGGSYTEWIADSNSMYRTLGDSIDVYTRDMDVHTETGAALTVLAASAAFRANPYVADASVVFVNQERSSAYRRRDRHVRLRRCFPSSARRAARGFYDDIVWVNETGTARL